VQIKKVNANKNMMQNSCKLVSIRTRAMSRRSYPIEPLSGRELEILELLAQGFTNQEIAEHLYISLATVKTHNSNIFGKLGVKNRMQAVALTRKSA
jgi:LuxR family transcriptional regulator, maltose regulon positive regulatory protein